MSRGNAVSAAVRAGRSADQRVLRQAILGSRGKDQVHGHSRYRRFGAFSSSLFSVYTTQLTPGHLQIVSLANPWLDFLTPDEAVKAAHDLNLDTQQYCSTYPAEASTSSSSQFSAKTKNRLFAFGSLPLVPGVETSKVLEAIEQVKSLSHLRGVVMGTRGVGKGLDDAAMEPIWKALADAGLVVFVVSLPRASRSRPSSTSSPTSSSRDSQHPHYGVEGAFGEQDNGHVLALALGFPFETTIVSSLSVDSRSSRRIAS